jgi:hypothetical protein
MHLLEWNNKVRIVNTRGQVLEVTRSQVQHILERDDLDVHRRRMYEAALKLWQEAEQKQQ